MKELSIQSQRFLQNAKIQFLAQDICVWVQPGMAEIGLFHYNFMEKIYPKNGQVMISCSQKVF